MNAAEFDHAVRAHDDLVRQRGVTIWIGSEPTFTDRWSETPEWLREALGPIKEERARAMVAALRDKLAGGIILRTLGRQYPGEERPRWCLGLYARRDGQPLWGGPLDPLLGEAAPIGEAAALDAFADRLTERLRQRGWPTARFDLTDPPRWRLVFHRDGQSPSADPGQHPRLARPSVHGHAIPLEGLRDDLAENGDFLVAIDWIETAPGVAVPFVELPSFPSVESFLEFLAELGPAASGLDRLILGGFPPPIDDTVFWTTLTPDPAVVEVNLAPALDAATFLTWHRELFTLAEHAGLAPYRLHYNGQIADSGGGGQITLGGPSPATSPFFLHPHLLPSLIRYLNRHPALSYYFAFDCLGSTSQAPRADENTHESFRELALALALLERVPNPSPELLWSGLSPFLTDLAGNAHRSEINIEKLWNPYLPGRGCLGLVEFRAFRMAPTPEKITALAVLLRAILLLLSQRSASDPLIQWGDDLHDRFALPFYLRQDLASIVRELAEAGLAPGQPIVDALLDDGYYRFGDTVFQGCRLSVRRALEFWPLVGDVASQEHGGARLVDASTARLEVCLRPAAGQEPAELDEWRLAVNGYGLPLRREEDREGPARVFGLRYRRFKPWIGLHPTLDAQGPIELMLAHPRHTCVLRVTLHEWKPEGGGYAGLPADADEARRRCEERFVVERINERPAREIKTAPAKAQAPYSLDLRWL